MTMDGPSLILLFVKAPIKGRVKSRLASALSDEAAVELYRSFVLDILATVDASSHPCRICIYPPDAREFIAAWLGHRRQYVPQSGDDLGSRMANAFQEAFASGVSRAVLIGSDVPDLPAEVIADAFAGLQGNDAVIGPAVDGGYYLIGFRNDTFRPDVFQDIRWGTDSVLRETRERFIRAGSRVHNVRQWQDVDTVEDLHSLRRRMSGTAFERTYTVQALKRFYGTM
jgi:rSAM/selenodomain-associated transferase 1